MLGTAAAPTRAAKATKMTLFQSAGNEVMHGICINDPFRDLPNPEIPYYAVRKLYVRKNAAPSERGQSGVFVALIEPYAGTPEIVEKRYLSIEGNSNDDSQAVAVELKTASGRTDLCFADGKSGIVRTIPTGIRVCGDAAFVSRFPDGRLREATVSGGTLLECGDEMKITPSIAEYRTRIVAVDYAKMSFTVEPALPPKILDGCFFTIGGDEYKTTYRILSVTTEGTSSRLCYDKDSEIYRARVIMVYDDIVRLSIAGSPPAAKGWYATTEDYRKVWHAESVPGGNRWNGFGVKLKPVVSPNVVSSPVSPDDFSPGSGLTLQYFGPGDEVTLKPSVSLSRREGDAWRVRADVKFSLSRKGMRKAQVSLDADSWWSVEIGGDDAHRTIVLDPVEIGSSEFHLRMGVALE
jgi:hypothetical protein